MAFIDAKGLFEGDRLRTCSDMAQLLWPRFMLAVNGYARIKLDYDDISRSVFASLHHPPSSEQLSDYFREYQENHLAFVYFAGGEIWAQFECPEDRLPRYKTISDKQSPAPDPEKLQAWREAYAASKALANTHAFAALCRNFPKVTEGYGSLPEVSAVEKSSVVKSSEEKRESKSKSDQIPTITLHYPASPAFNAGPKPADDGFDREHGFAELHALYPKREDGHAAQVAYCESLIGRSLIAGCGAREAHCWLMQRVAVYVKLTPIAFMHGMTQFLVKGIYKQDDTAWQRGSNSESASKVLSTPRVSAADRRRKQLLDDPNTAPEVKAKLRQQAAAAGAGETKGHD